MTHVLSASHRRPHDCWRGGFAPSFAVTGQLGQALPHVRVSLRPYHWVLLLEYLLPVWESGFPNRVWGPAPCPSMASALSTVSAGSWHHAAPFLQSLKDKRRGSQNIISLGRLAVACCWVRPLISSWAFKVMVLIGNAMSHVDSPGPNEGGRRDGGAATLLRSI